MYLVMGAPGTGKTILGNQLCFAHVAGGGRAIYVTLLTESHTRLLAHLQTLTFYDHNVVGDRLLYFSGYSVLAKDGLDGLFAMLRQTIHTQHATLLVIDGLGTISLGTANELAFKEFLQRLQIVSEIESCTTVLISHQAGRESSSEQVMVDGLLELSNRQIGLRVVRELEIWKLRGSRYLDGRHQCTITNAGLTIYPRIEAVLAGTLVGDTAREARASFGIQELDALLGGGLQAGSTTMIFGAPGSGKTVLGLHFLAAGLVADELGLYFGFKEMPARLYAKAARLSLGLDSDRARELISIAWHPRSEKTADALAGQLLDTVLRRQVRRLVIDGLDGLLKTLADPERIQDFFASLASQLRAREVTTVFALDMRDVIGASISIPRLGVSETTDNIICLRYVEVRSQLRRFIWVLKQSDGPHNSTIHEFQITQQGIQVGGPFIDIEG
jgi:circadian clock protein KaiC